MAPLSRLPSKKRIFCNTCNTETNHLAQADYSHRNEDSVFGWEEHIYRLWICAGCESGSLEVLYTNPTWTREDGEQEYDAVVYPSRTKDYLGVKIFVKLPEKLHWIYQETIRAYNEELDILCAAGLRALIEGICEDKGIRGRNLETKIDGLTSFLPSSIVGNLHNFRFMGNIAIHELTPPERYELGLAIEISEDLLNYLYELDYKASLLSFRRQRRTATNTSSSSGGG